MSSFRPPLRKRAAVKRDDNSTDELGCSESHASAQSSQEVLSCGFLPPKQPKRTPFRPPLRDLVSPGVEYINRILHEPDEEEEEDGEKDEEDGREYEEYEEGEENGVSERVTSSGLNFELAPLHNINNQDDKDAHTLKSATLKRRHYYYHVGNRKIEQLVKSVKHRNSAMNTGCEPTSSASCTDERFKIFEFQPSQDVKNDKPNQEKCINKQPLVEQHCINMDVYYAVKKARQEIKEIRRRYAAKKAGCVIQAPLMLQEDRQPLKVSVNFLAEEKIQLQPQDEEMQFFFSSTEGQDVILHEE